MGSFDKENLNLSLLSETIDQKIAEGEWQMDVLQNQLDQTEMEAIYGIQSSWIQEFLVRRPLISITCDEIAIFHTVEDKHQDVIEALKRYQEEWQKACILLSEQAEQIAQAQIVEYGSYVVFVCGEDQANVLQYIGSLS